MLNASSSHFDPTATFGDLIGRGRPLNNPARSAILRVTWRSAKLRELGSMRRRDFIKAIIGSAASWPFAARAQQAGKVWRVGMLDTTSATLNAKNIDAFKAGMNVLGYVEGQNLVIDYRSADGRLERLPALVTELIDLRCDVIVTRGTPPALAARNASRTIPIVMASIGEPVEAGLVQSLSRPGGNVTGLSAFVTQLTQKRIEIIKELAPRITRIGALDNTPAFLRNGTRPNSRRRHWDWRR
jgi:putative ABC transport system substrate-binding protein